MTKTETVQRKVTRIFPDHANFRMTDDNYFAFTVDGHCGVSVVDLTLLRTAGLCLVSVFIDITQPHTLRVLVSCVRHY